MLLVALCGLVVAGASGYAQTAPDQEVTLNFLTQGEPDTLDPNRATLANASVVRQVFEPLLRFDQNLVPQPAAAASYEVSADGLTYTFHLRSDGRWSDGQSVTAGQFAYSWKRLLDPKLQAAYAPLFVDAGIVGADDYNRGRTTANSVGITAVDDQTLRIRLTQPFGALPDLAALWVGVPVREDLVASDPDGWASDAASYVGNGPFVVSEWVHQDHITLKPNPEYVAHLGWPKPTLTKVTMTMSTDAEADYQEFVNGSSIDWALVPDLDVNHVLNDPSLTSQSKQYNDLTTFWLQFNTARPALSNVLVRRALSKAIDRDALVRDLAAGVSIPSTSVVPPGMPGFQNGLGKELGFDPVGARALLAEAQASPDLSFSYVDTPSNRRRAAYLQALWRANLGIEVQLKEMDQAAYEQALEARDYDLAFGGWKADYPDPQDWLGLVFGCKATFNRFNYCDPNFDQIAARADIEASLPDRLQLYGQAQTLLIQDVPVAPLFARGHLVLIKPWVQSIDGGPLVVTPLDDYPGSLFLDRVQILPH